MRECYTQRGKTVLLEKKKSGVGRGQRERSQGGEIGAR